MRASVTVRSFAVGCALALASTLLVACSHAVAIVPLPDGRAWELVSPPEKNGGEINGIDGVIPDNGPPEGGIVQAAPNGGSITYVSLLAFPGSEGEEPLGAPIASQYLSARKDSGWLTENITTPVSSKTYPTAGNGSPYEAFSSDLLAALVLNGSPGPVENPLPPHLTGTPPARYQNYYLRDDASGSFIALLNDIPPEEPPSEFSLKLLGATPDLGHIAVGAAAALTPEATRQERGNLYEWADNRSQSLQPINVLPLEAHPGHPEETASGGALLGMGNDESNTISSDGSRVFWSQPETASLFVRKDIGTSFAQTIQIDASHGPDPSGLGQFKTASADGSKVFFTDERKLTPDATAGEEATRQDLYRFNIESGQLTDLTVDTADTGGASVLGVLATSGDGSYVYFVAEGGLQETGATAGNDNLYVWHEGSVKFIGALSSDDSGHGGFHEPVIAHDWDASTGDRTARVTPDGRHLVFMSDARLTDYDNRDANTGLPDEEVYLYDATFGRLSCVSCNPSGARPVGPSGIPGGTPWRAIEEEGTYQSRVLSEDGSRVFFDSTDALVSQDTNGAQDVYEWERDDTGTCRLESGCAFLLSGATSASESSFVDASLSGSDVFFLTRAQLVGQDTDQLRDLYDARVGGGFPSPAQLSPPCDGESCLPSPSGSSPVNSLASTTFSGIGNLAPLPHKQTAKKTKARKKGKSKKRKKHPTRKTVGTALTSRRRESRMSR